MRKLLLLVCLVSVCLGASAQSRAQGAAGAQGTPGMQGADGESTREQRRLELRSVLQEYRNQDRSIAVGGAASGRQLSSQEHAEMRRQLRQYQPDRQSRP